MITFTLPIYYTVERKTKKSSTHFVGDNWFYPLHYIAKNNVKQHYHDLIASLVSSIPSKPYEKFSLSMVLYYKNKSCDPSNCFHIIEKFVLDGLQDIKVISNDSVLNHFGTTTINGGMDKTNPRIEITLKDIND